MVRIVITTKSTKSCKLKQGNPGGYLNLNLGSFCSWPWTLVDSSPSSGVALNGQTYVRWSLRLGGKLSTRFQLPKLKEVLLQLVLFMDVIYLVYNIYALGFMVLICMLSYIKWWLQELHSMVEWLSKDKCKMNFFA